MTRRRRRWSWRKRPPAAGSSRVPASPAATTDNINALIKTLSNLKATKFVAHGVANPDPSYEFAIEKDALVITLTVEGQAEPIQLTLGKPDGDTAYFAISPQLKGDVFLVPKEPFKAAREKPAYFK